MKLASEKTTKRRAATVGAFFCAIILFAACQDNKDESTSDTSIAWYVPYDMFDYTCIDADKDGYGEGCELGPDCDDHDQDHWDICPVCEDLDKDGPARGHRACEEGGEGQTGH